MIVGDGRCVERRNGDFYGCGTTDAAVMIDRTYDPTGATGESSAGHEAFDMEVALDRLGGDRELFNELIRFFCQGAPQLLDQLQAAVAGEDVAELHRAAHALKGLAANFEGKQAVHAAFCVEQPARNGDLAAAIEAAPAVQREFARLHQALVARNHRVS